MTMKRYNILLGFIMIPALSLLLIWDFGKRPEGTLVLSAKAAKNSFSVLVEAVGELDAARSTVIFSQIRGDRGKIIYITSDGIEVKKGDLLVRLDPTFFEEEVARLTAEVRQWEAVVTSNEQLLEWEKVQSIREAKALEFDLRAARLDLTRLKRGDGPLELYRLEGTAQKARQDWQEKDGYLAELQALEKEGYINIAEIAQLQNQISEAKETYELARRQYESYRDYVLPALIENAQAQVARAEMNLEQFKKGAGFKIGKAMATLKKAQQSLESTTASLKTAQAELERTAIRAPIPGIAVLPEAFRGGKKRKPRVGDIVWQNQPLVYLPDVFEMVVKTQIREIDLHKVDVDQEVMLFVDAYPDLRLRGKVQSIGVLAESKAEFQTADKYFQVVISVNEKDKRLRPGMTARVEIKSATVVNALTIPVHAVFSLEGRNYCYVEIKTGYEKREITIGAQNEDWAQVLGGLTEGEDVALSQPPPDKIRKGRELTL